MKFILLLFLISIIDCKITEEEIKFLKSKVTTKLNIEDIDSLKERLTENSNILKETPETIIYNPDIIDKIIKDDLGYEQNYNYLEDNKITPHIKDQKSCGCCWSMSATSSLSYRFSKNGDDINLSPQDGLSCYLRDCDAGNYLIDPQLNLIKNGTVTEECEPFVSGDGEYIPKCPSLCKDGTAQKRYYAKNAYTTENYYSAENFYAIVIIMLQELVNKGPLVSSIQVFKDFVKWHDDEDKCKNDIYSYDYKSDYVGGHAVTIVGYGKIGARYYWLVQNSWGICCDNGFVKVEMGQIGIENVAILEPYMPDETQIKTDVNVNFISLDKECTLTVDSDSNSSVWENVLEVSFKNKDYENDRLFSYQCNIVNILGESQKMCNTELYGFLYIHKGNYEYYSSSSLGTENNFILDEAFKKKSFYYYGMHYLEYYFDNYVFVSEEGSNFLLYFYNIGQEFESPPIHPNENSTKTLSNCEAITLAGVDLVSCKLTKEELNEFPSFDSGNNNPLFYNYGCEGKESTYLVVSTLNKSLYPVFRVKKILVETKNSILYENTPLTLIADIEGKVSNFYTNRFFSFIDIDYKGENTSYAIFCQISNPSTGEKDYKINCVPSYNEDGESHSFNHIYLKPYYITRKISIPYEIIINDTILANIISSSSSFMKVTMSLFLALFLLL